MDIIQEIEKQTDGEVKLGPGTLYNSIKRMLDDGLIAETDTPTGDDPRRIYYRITDRGLVAFRAEATRLERFVESARAKTSVPEEG